MANYAIVKNGIVENTIVCGPQDIPTHIPEGILYAEYDDLNPAVIGLSYDGTLFEQMPPSATSGLLISLAEGFQS